MENTEKKYFYGHELSKEEIARNRISFATLSRCFDAILCNNIVEVDDTIWDNFISGSLSHYEDKKGNWIDEDTYLNNDDTYEIQDEVYQWYIVSDNAVELLKEAGELVLYSEKLDIYIWGVQHWGTAWDMVFTQIKIDSEGR